MDQGRAHLQRLLYAALRDPAGAPGENFNLHLAIGIGLDGLFYAGLAALWLVALLLVLPRGMLRDEYPTLLAIFLAFTLGRSFLGVGEGFSTSFLFLNLLCGGMALAAYSVLTGKD